MTHEKLLETLKPLIDLMNEGEFNYIVIAGKDSTCARYMRGSSGELQGMIEGMMQNNKVVEKLIKDSANEYVPSKAGEIDSNNQISLF